MSEDTMFVPEEYGKRIQDILQPQNFTSRYQVADVLKGECGSTSNNFLRIQC